MVTLTNSFLDKIKMLVNPARIKNEWDLFKTYARQRYAGTLCRVVGTLDNITYGKQTAKVAHDEMVALCVGATIALERTPKLAEVFLKEIENRIEADQKLPKIQKSFPEFAKTPASVPAILMEYKGIPGTFLSMLALSNWLDHEEFVLDAIGIARYLDLLRIAYDAKRVYGKIKSQATLVEDDRRGMQFLRNIAERQVLVATMQNIPYVPTKFEKRDKQLRSLCGYILRFPVKEDLETLITQSESEAEVLYKDILDFFVDYPQGEARKKGLKNFALLCKQYSLLSAKE